MKTKKEILEIFRKYTDEYMDGGYSHFALPSDFYEKVAEEILQPKIYTWSRDGKI